MTEEEFNEIGFPHRSNNSVLCIELNDGTRLFPGQDIEGNGPGFFNGIPEDPKELIDEEISSVQPMSAYALRQRRWPVDNPHLPAPPVITLSNGDKIFPSQDVEGNGPGVVFGVSPESEGGEPFVLTFS